MGNCLMQEQKVIRVMKSDGKILEYESPIKVQQILSDFSGHALSASSPSSKHLQPDSKLIRGQLYYLIPLPPPAPARPQNHKSKKKKVRFANPEVKGEEGSAGVVRVKLIISKQEFEELLREGVSVHDMQSEDITKGSQVQTCQSDGGDDCREGKPVLESIPEMNQ